MKNSFKYYPIILAIALCLSYLAVVFIKQSWIFWHTENDRIAIVISVFLLLLFSALASVAIDTIGID